MKAVLATIGALAAVVVIAVAGWQFGWWLQAKTVDRQVGIDNRQKGTQTAWRDQTLQNIRDFYVVPATDSATRSAIRVQICDIGSRLTTSYRTDQIDQFIAKEC